MARVPGTVGACYPGIAIAERKVSACGESCGTCSRDTEFGCLVTPRIL
jgi:hypothetical protein